MAKGGIRLRPVAAHERRLRIYEEWNGCCIIGFVRNVIARRSVGMAQADNPQISINKLSHKYRIEKTRHRPPENNK